jgi:MFS family permease
VSQVHPPPGALLIPCTALEPARRTGSVRHPRQVASIFIEANPACGHLMRTHRTVPFGMRQHRPALREDPFVTRDRANAASSPVVGNGGGHPRRWAVLAVLCAVAFMARLDFFIVNVALDGIDKDFPGSNLSVASWVLNAYAIIFAALLVPAGRIADLWGRKRVLLGGFTVFTAASAVCAVAPDLGVLIGGRAVQAVVAAMIVPTSLGLLYPNFPTRQHTLVVGVWAGVAAVAASAGPPVGGLLVGVSWRWIFVINLPIGGATIVAGIVLIPEVRQPPGSRLPDMDSVVSLVAAVSLLVLATVQGPSWGWGDPRTIVLFALAVLSGLWRSDGRFVPRHRSSSRRYSRAARLPRRRSACSCIVRILYLPARCGFVHAERLALLGGPSRGRDRSRARRVHWVRGERRTDPESLRSNDSGRRWNHGNGRRRIDVVLYRPRPVGLLVGDVPAMIVMVFSGGLSQAPMYAAAGTLAPERATTGSAVLNMSGQVRSAVGVSLLVALTATNDPLQGYVRAWVVQAGLGFAAAAALLAIGQRRASTLADPVPTLERSSYASSDHPC